MYNAHQIVVSMLEALFAVRISRPRYNVQTVSTVFRLRTYSSSETEVDQRKDMELFFAITYVHSSE